MSLVANTFSPAVRRRMWRPLIWPILVAAALILAILSLHSVVAPSLQASAEPPAISTDAEDNLSDSARDTGSTGPGSTAASSARTISDRDGQYCAEPVTCIETASVVTSPLVAQTSPSPIFTASQLGFIDRGGVAGMLPAAVPPALSSAVIRV